MPVVGGHLVCPPLLLFDFDSIAYAESMADEFPRMFGKTAVPYRVQSFFAPRAK